MSAGMLATALLSAFIPAAFAQGVNQAGVVATFPNGATNPAAPSLAAVGSVVDQKSMSRLLSLNGVDDFCLYGPPEAGPDSLIGNIEPIAVAYCSLARNGARIIPDGTIHSAHFVKTPMYVQIQGFWDGTKVNVVDGDYGGELDPHGAENLGNPIGGNVTSDVSGSDVFYQEWMSFISFDQFCLRICTANRADVDTALQCEHELDVMGCQWVMPGDYTNGTFDSCEGEAAAPPGIYPTPTNRQGQDATVTTTFKQRYTGTYTNSAGVAEPWTVGNEVTPTAPAYIPATSSCTYYATVANGINTADMRVVERPSLQVVSSGAVMSTTSAASSAATSSAASSRASSSSSSAASTSGATSARTTAPIASAAASTTPASAGFKSVDTSLFGVAGVLFAGVIGGMAVLL